MKKMWMIFGCFFSLGCITTSSQTTGIKTNIPYWGTLTPNLGIEVALGKKQHLKSPADLIHLPYPIINI